MSTSAALNAVQPLQCAAFPLGPFSSQNGCRTEKQLNSPLANENRCGFANYVSRTLAPHCRLSFNPSLRRAFPLRHRRRRRRHRRASFSRKSLQNPEECFRPNALLRRTFGAEARNFYYPACSPAVRAADIFHPSSVASPLLPSLRSCREQRDKAAFRFTQWN